MDGNELERLLVSHYLLRWTGTKGRKSPEEIREGEIREGKRDVEESSRSEGPTRGFLSTDLRRLYRVLSKTGETFNSRWIMERMGGWIRL